MNEICYFLVFLFVSFLSYLIIFRSFPPFSNSSLSLFLLFNPYHQDFFLSLLLPLLNYLSLFIMFFLSSFISLSCLIQFFQSFVFANFSLSFIWNIVPLWYRSLFRFTSTYSAFFISQICWFVFFLFHSFKTCSHSHREIRTNMHDKGTKRNDNANEPFLCLAVRVRCCTGS